METILKEANDIILKQRQEIEKARNNQDLKMKIKQLENDHIAERKQSQREFEVFKQSMTEKEAHLERDYKEKAMEMKDNLVQIKKRFEDRCADFKAQLAEFKNNNEAIEALKKAHAKELAAHVQEHNKKYNELLQAKLDSEDKLKEQAEKEKHILKLDYEQKMKKALDELKRQMESQMKTKLKEQQEVYERQLENKDDMISQLQEEIRQMEKKLRERDLTIQGKDGEIIQQKSTIKNLEAEIQRLIDMNNKGGMESAELNKLLMETERKLKDALAHI